MLYDPGGTCTVLAYRPAHFCLRPRLGYRLPHNVLTRLNRFTLSHYGSRTLLSTLHAGLTASHARLDTGCLLGFAGSGLSPDYTIHAELAHNLRTFTPVRACRKGDTTPPEPSEPFEPYFITLLHNLPASAGHNPRRSRAPLHAPKTFALFAIIDNRENERQGLQ